MGQAKHQAGERISLGPAGATSKPSFVRLYSPVPAQPCGSQQGGWDLGQPRSLFPALSLTAGGSEKGEDMQEMKGNFKCDCDAIAAVAGLSPGNARCGSCHLHREWVQLGNVAG